MKKATEERQSMSPHPLLTDGLGWRAIVEPAKDAYWNARRHGKDENSALYAALDVAVAATSEPSDGQIYASVGRRDALRQVLGFLESIEGSGYGGMAEFEIARSSIRHEVEGPMGWALSEEAKAQIAEIEGNSRNATINGDRFVAGAKPSSS